MAARLKPLSGQVRSLYAPVARHPAAAVASAAVAAAGVGALLWDHRRRTGRRSQGCEDARLAEALEELEGHPT